MCRDEHCKGTLAAASQHPEKHTAAAAADDHQMAAQIIAWPRWCAHRWADVFEETEPAGYGQCKRLLSPHELAHIPGQKSPPESGANPALPPMQRYHRGC